MINDQKLDEILTELKEIKAILTGRYTAFGGISHEARPGYEYVPGSFGGQGAWFPKPHDR